MKRRTLFLETHPVEVRWEESSKTVDATVNDRSYRLEVRKLDSQTRWFNYGGRSVEACVIRRDGKYEVSILGRKLLFEVKDATTARRRSGSTSGTAVVEVRAPMPGKVVRVLLQNQDPVEPRQGIVVMEAMKMQNEIRAPRGGRILALHVSEGDAVNAGDLIASVGD